MSQFWARVQQVQTARYSVVTEFQLKDLNRFVTWRDRSGNERGKN